jgi:membrane-associated protease RseP (regulator of RpoE activity)
MAFALSLLLFILSLFAIVMIHEGGHYLAARKFNFRVLEYFLGFGPRLWSFRRGEIEYGVKAIPAGGYVKIAGMNPFENDVPEGDEHRAYSAKPTWQRITVILAGPMSHFLVAGILFSALLVTVGDGHVAKIVGVQETFGDVTTPAADAGLQPGDLIVKFGDVDNPDQAAIGDWLDAHQEEPTAIIIDRGGQLVATTVTPVWDAELSKFRVGIQMGPVPRPLVSSIGHGFEQVGTLTAESARGIVHAFGPSGVVRMFTLLTTDTPRDEGDVASVVGVGGMVGNMGAQGDWAQFVFVFAYVTLFIGLVNLIPLPPLDGGHVAIAVIEKLRGRRIDMKKVVPVSAAVLAILGFFSISAMILDVWKPIPVGP